MRKEPIESVQVVLESLFGVVAGMAENADGTVVVAVGDDFEELPIQFTLTEREDFYAFFIAVSRHSIQIESEQVGLHFGEQVGEAIEVFVAVMQVVHDADVLAL